MMLNVRCDNGILPYKNDTSSVPEHHERDVILELSLLQAVSSQLKSCQLKNPVFLSESPPPSKASNSHDQPGRNLPPRNANRKPHGLRSHAADWAYDLRAASRPSRSRPSPPNR